MEDMKRCQIPAFGYWEYCNEVPITRHFESASQHSLFQSTFFDEEHHFNVPAAMAIYSANPYSDTCRRKVRKGKGAGEVKQYSMDQQERKQGRVCDATSGTPRRCRAPMAVDEDLYKIPPHLLYPKPKRKRLLRKLLSGCMGLNCIC